MSQYDKTYGLRGGMDLVTPPIERKGGNAIGGYNYEPRPEGYRLIAGFERWDGSGLPSEAVYHVMQFENGTVAFAAGDVVTGAASGASCELLQDPVVLSGDYTTANAAGYIVVGALSGAFEDGEFMQVGGFSRATLNGLPVLDGGTNDADHRAFEAAAIELKRSKVGKVPGTGPIRGVWDYSGATYAFRDNASATACIMYRSTPNGWESVPLGYEVAFSAGTGAIAEGDTVTGATSAATATVKRVIVQSGDWTTNDAAGRLIFASVSGAFTDGENLQVDAVTKAIASGASAAITLQPGGRYEFINENFYAGSQMRRMYGCDGVNRAFEFDGEVFAQIHTGTPVDAPIHIAEHSNYLILGFRGGSVQFSSLGRPLEWQFITGAGELGMGDDVTGFVSGYASALIIFARNKIGALYGKVLGGDNSDADLQIVRKKVGAFEWSVQDVGQPVFYDNAGVRDLTSTQTYGNFSPSVISKYIKPYLDKKRQSGTKVTASFVVTEQSQYWLFFDDMTGLIFSFASSKVATMPVRYDRVVRCACSVENDEGDEVIYMGSDDGYVYRVNSGSSYDGQPLDFLLRLAFNNLGYPTMNKRFIQVALEMNTGANAQIGVSADFSYGSPTLPSVTREEFDVYGGGGFWDEVYWDNFYWSQVEGTAEAYIDGFGSNISVAIGGSVTTEPQHTLHGITYYFSPRKKKR